MALLLKDPELLARFRSGETEVLSQVYRSYFQQIEGYIRRGLCRAGPRVARGRAGTVADLVQESFTHAFSQSARLAYDGTREYGRFITTIARNTLIDYLRRQNQEEPVDPCCLERHLDHGSFEETDEFAQLDPRIRALTQRYLSKLSEREHAVYVLRYAEEQSQLQAANTLGMTRQQIRTLEERVRAGLARELARTRLSAGACEPQRSVAKRKWKR
jgi:RNA polymerase sigma-70 factor, ECF subfamily